MTSFHDILGTNNNSTPAEIKRCYKQLSNRCHPDKGGSKALMQMVSQAYDKVSAGKGNEEAVRTVLVKGQPGNDQWKEKYQKLEIAHTALRHDYQSLERQLKSAKEKLQQTANQTHEEDRLKAALEEDVKILRRENRRLQKQLDSARWELSDRARGVVPTQSANSSSASESSPISASLAEQIEAIGSVNYRKWALLVCVPLLLLGAAYQYGEQGWKAMQGWFIEPEQTEPTVRIVEAINNNEPEAGELANQQQPTLAQEPPKPVPQIRLVKDIGVWQLSYYENTEQPYISVRSEKGSYIVKNCQSDFQYYRNANVRSRRMAANLIFDKRERQFEVFNIPYGNGSFAANWAASKSLLINKEYFPNDNFSRAYDELQTHCLSMSASL
ncbi:molecular chaperone DnaJ [Photobacterium sanctipauli]|uniref:Molecular chaperone DnaJ n=1 Tax=Photobacterium sanctipauli TaxID=1342794 RepID=A0A2T3NZ84_9GAMM|nr:DnaJ domain-containing protein [Photobacterium sanctipauli]PSW21528.1 molecular chaperone DnaJ [Photobacterium sanctipauli]